MLDNMYYCDSSPFDKNIWRGSAWGYGYVLIGIDKLIVPYGILPNSVTVGIDGTVYSDNGNEMIVDTENNQIGNINYVDGDILLYAQNITDWESIFLVSFKTIMKTR